MTLLTAQQVRERTFTVRRTLFHEGYDLDEVDAFLDQVVDTLNVHEKKLLHHALDHPPLINIHQRENHVVADQGECPSTVAVLTVPTAPVQQNAAHGSNGGR